MALHIAVIAFYAWWLLVNGFVYYSELHFITLILNKNGRNHMSLWIFINAFFTFVITFFQMPGMLLPHILLLFVFSTVILKIHWIDSIAPVTIILTLSTFMEGFSALFMSVISANVNSVEMGTLIQALLSLLSAAFFWFALRLIRKRYVFTVRQTISSCLYILLLPCVFLVLIIRYGLRLDSSDFEYYLSGFGISAGIAFFLIMVISVLIFFMMLEVFSKIITLTERDRDRALFDSQFKRQRIYVEEAKKRDELYRSFQHDIDNHLLVLSGLLKENRYEEALEYLGKLHVNSASLLVSLSTGHIVLDTLLKEKLGHAERNGIGVTCNVRIPEDSAVDDMDLCVIFANIMDNAIRACMESEQDERAIVLTAGARYRFLVIESFNPSSGSQPVRPGTGLKNIGSIAKKYGGTVSFGVSDGQFRIHVLLCLSESGDMKPLAN